MVQNNTIKCHDVVNYAVIKLYFSRLLMFRFRRQNFKNSDRSAFAAAYIFYTFFVLLTWTNGSYKCFDSESSFQFSFLKLFLGHSSKHFLDFWLKLRLDNNHCSLLIVKFISVDLINTQKNDVFQKCQHIKDCYFINLSQKFNLFLLEAIAETFGEDGSYGEIYIPIVVP